MSPLCLVFLMLLWLCSGSCRGYYNLEVGDPCPTSDYRSNCQPAGQCTTLMHLVRSGRMAVESVLNCGLTVTEEKVCCPLETDGTALRFSPSENKFNDTKPATATTTTEASPWLSIFKTDRDYVQSIVAMQVPVSRDRIVFPDSSKANSEACQSPLYEGSCLAISQCPSLEPLLQQRRLRDDDIQTCRDGTFEEIICCPTNLPLQPRGQLSTESRVTKQPLAATTVRLVATQFDGAAIANAEELLPHYKHLAALAYPNAAFDGHLHRCTALALTPQLLLSAAGCGRASHAVFGVADMRDVDEDEDYLVDITRIALHRQDLALLRLPHPLPLDAPNLAAKVTLAPLCTQFELTRLQVSGQLLASAWAKGNASDCPFYELPMRLLPIDACKGITNLSGVQDLPSKHLCLAPTHIAALSSSNSSSCAPCPAVVGSVLHLRRSSGSRCVLAIATPTGATCDAQAMFFTSLLDKQFFHFVEQQQQQQQQQQKPTSIGITGATARILH